MAISQSIEHLQPTSTKSLYSGNYLNFLDGSIGDTFAQQFLPDVYEKESEIWGNRTIGGFLKMVSAEMPMSSDQVIWTEQGRLHTRYVNLFGNTASDAKASASIDLDGHAVGTAVRFSLSSTAGDQQPGNGVIADDEITLRVGQLVMVAKQASIDSTTGDTLKGIVAAASANSFTVQFYTAAPDSFINATTDVFTVLAFGSEFGKGTGNFTDKIDPQYSTYSNSPIIMKEHYSLYGSDATQIGWIEVSSENGASGYLWYVKAEHENRLRWEDHQEMTMLEAIDKTGTAEIALTQFRSDYTSEAPTTNAKGTEGFFSALDARANAYEGLEDDLAVGGRNGLAAFDNILKTLDKNGAIEENMLYINRDLALEFDNLLASQSDYTQNGGGASWGVFNNSASMALDLGFTGFRRGSYDFYKTDWKYLNDFSTRGGFSDIEGVMIPAGTSTVYDQGLGKNIKRPFLHVRYRASETENRKNKSWITGSVGGAYTTDIDELRMHYLTERCIVTQGANNFFKFNG